MTLILGNGKYIYFETSNPVKRGDRAVLQSAIIKANSSLRCLTFAYHMYGQAMGRLELERVHPVGFKSILFHNSRSEHRWKEYSVNLTTESFDYVVS